MLSDDPNYKIKVYQKLVKNSRDDHLPKEHVEYLEKIRNQFNFYPEVCYDIGASLTHWTQNAKKIWPNTTCVLFDAFEPAEILYADHSYYMGVLSDEDGKEIKFYQNDILIGGNSYYRENTYINEDINSSYFPPENYLIKKTRTLDSVVKEKNFPQPQLIKIDVQGAELDILKGAEETLRNTKLIIVELQHDQYNIGAPLCNVTKQYLEKKGWLCLAEKFSYGKHDADYCFINFNLLNN